MQISSLRRHLPTQGTEKGKELAQSMLHGETLKSQINEEAVEQLATVPEPWLERLKDEGMAYVALGFGEDLSQTDLIVSYTPERLKNEAVKAKVLAAEVRSEVDSELAADIAKTDDGFRKAMLERGKPDLIKEKLAARLDEANIGFAIKVTRDIVPLAFLESEYGVFPTDYDEFLEPMETERGVFRDVLLDLNGPELVADQGAKPGPILNDDATLDPEDDIILIPYGVYNEKRLSPVSKDSYQSINGMMMDQHHGAHYWPNRLIVLDDEAAMHPSPLMGDHSVVLHETGHAIDYIAEGIAELNHRETMDAFYEQDKARYKSGDNRFLTPRAMDNAREYFAEAVEAYLTTPPEQSSYKGDNNHVELKERNPELYAYVDRLMRLPSMQNPG